MTIERCREPILVLDDRPWYRSRPQLKSAAHSHLGHLYPRVMGHEDVAECAHVVVREAVPPGAIVLVALTAAALYYPQLLPHCLARDCVVVPLTMSRHPYVTFAFDPPALREATLCAYHEATSRTIEFLRSRLDAARARSAHFVYLDVNSGTGRDAVLVEQLIARAFGADVKFTFGVLVEESAEDERYSTGWREGPKVRIPDVRAMRLIGHNTKYLSHIAFLQQEEAAQYESSAYWRTRFPSLLRFWDDVSTDLRRIHAYDQSSAETIRRRLHLRYSKSEIERNVPEQLANAWAPAALHEFVGAEDTCVEWRLAQVHGFRSIPEL